MNNQSDSMEILCFFLSSTLFLYFLFFYFLPFLLYYQDFFHCYFYYFNIGLNILNSLLSIFYFLLIFFYFPWSFESSFNYVHPLIPFAWLITFKFPSLTLDAPCLTHSRIIPINHATISKLTLLGLLLRIQLQLFLATLFQHS